MCTFSTSARKKNGKDRSHCPGKQLFLNFTSLITMCGISYSVAAQEPQAPDHKGRSRAASQSVVGGSAQAEPTNVSSGSCRFDYECDDCNLCTEDRCVAQVCVNTPLYACTSCDDGFLCNGEEICDLDGVCRSGESQLPCRWYSEYRMCDEQAWSVRGPCVIPCTTDAVCDDGLECTGTEFCQPQNCVYGNNEGAACQTDADCDTAGGGYCGGVCRHNNIPCGEIEACEEEFCSQIGVGGGSVGDPCSVDVDCGTPGGVCTTSATCIHMGRCCTVDVSGELLTCNRTNKPDCDASGGLWLFIGDDPSVQGDQASCSFPATPNHPNPGERFQCPFYSSGIAPAETNGLSVGPISVATCATIHELGDDYVIAGADAGNDYVEVETIRFVGAYQEKGIQGSDDWAKVRFYTEAGMLIEELDFFMGGGNAEGLRTIVVPQIVIPARGWIALTTSVRDAPFARQSWSVTDVVDVGGNDPSVLWLNGGSVAASTVLPGGVDGVLAFEIVGNLVPAPIGACCNSGAAMCSEQLPWVCDSIGGKFQGAGTSCQSCAHDLYIECETDADCPVCVGGPSEGETCRVDIHCPGGSCVGGFCVGGENDTQACDPHIDCSGGTCTGTTTCNQEFAACTQSACCDATTGSCIEVTGGQCSDTQAACQQDADCVGAGAVCQSPCPAGTVPRGFGTSCTPNLCLQPQTGWDTCVEAGQAGNIIALDVASLEGCEEVTATATGNNLDATFNDNPGSCENEFFDPTGAAPDRGWWHAIIINACANVRVDFCGTEELFGDARTTSWHRLWKSCDPCGATISASALGDATVGGCVGSNTDSHGLGAPFCADDDAWDTFGPLAPGTYWYPVHSVINGSFGDYQMHITASACPLAACCLAQSFCVAPDESLVEDGIGDPIGCVDDSDCPGATCSFCAVMNELDCEDVGGKWNGYGSTRKQCDIGECVGGLCVGSLFDDDVPCFEDGIPPITTCATGECDIGSCCTGSDGEICNESSTVPGIPCDPMTPASCMNRTMCAADSGAFHGGVSCYDSSTPCNVCEFIGESNCQFPLGNGLVFMSDLAGPGNGVIVADDFMPFGDTISQLCVWGAYMDPSGPGVNMGSSEQFDCAGMVTDHFRIRVFEDIEGLPSSWGGIVFESEATGSNIVKEPMEHTFFEAFHGIAMHTFNLTLDTPITGLVPGRRYWLEVVNNTDDPPENTCYWHWAQHFPEESDGYSASGVGYRPWDFSGDILDIDSVYVHGSASGGADLAFCLHGASEPLEFETPPVRVAACWTCADPNGVQDCSRKTLFRCSRDGGQWNRDDLFCDDWTPVYPNDDCGYVPPSSEMARAGVTCGDGVIDPGEQCDDGNLLPDDGCDDQCRLECKVAIIEPGFGALQIIEGVYRFDNQCANTDGPILIRTEGGDSGIEADLWFAYTVSATGWATVSTCPSQTGWTKDGFTGLDSVLAIYHEEGTTCENGFNYGLDCQCPGSPPLARCVDSVQCPGGSGICSNQCPCPGDFPGVSPLQIGVGGDENCNGISDSGGGVQEFRVFSNECYLIRVGSWASFAPGTGNHGRGLVDVALERTICFPASPPVAQMGTSSTGTSVPWIKSRMLSFQGGDAGRNQAVRVTWKSKPPGWESWEGQSLFAQHPIFGTEQSGTPFYVDQGPGAPNSLVWSELGCEPFYTDWTQYGVVHLIHEAITPSKLVTSAGPVDIVGLYEIEIIDETCSIQISNHYSDPMEVRTAGWADVAELFSGSYVVPGDKVTVVDTLGMLDKFGNLPGAPSKASACLLGVDTGPVPRLDGKITISELVAVVGAFGGENYPFTEDDVAPPPGDCWP